MLTFIFVNILIVLIFVFWRKNVNKFRDIDQSLPGPPKHFLLGNVREFRNGISELLEDTGRLFDTYGSVVRIWIGPMHMKILIIEPTYMEFFMTSTVHLGKSSDVTGLLKPWLGKGLLTSSRTLWSQHRKILTPAFDFVILENFTKIFNNLSIKLVKKLTSEVEKDIDIYKFMQLFAVDAICESSMKYNLNSLDTEDTKFLDGIGEFMETFYLRIFSLLNKLDFPFSPFCKTHRDSLNELRGFSKTILDNRKKNRNKNIQDDKENPLIDIMLDNDQFNEAMILDQLNTFLFAGQDNLSTILALSLYELAKHPDVQQMILDELDEVGIYKEQPITMQQVNSMQYFDRVIKECLRLYSPTPFIERTVAEDIDFDGVYIPKGTVMTFNIFWMHRRADIYPDPERFDPDRFLLQNVAERHIFSYMPFSAGPRNCIGQQYAILNTKICIANILSSFELLPVDPPCELVFCTDGTLKGKGGVPVRLKIRG